MTIAHAGTILLVEADVALQHGMGTLLDHAGHKLLLAATVGEALRLAREHSPDLLVINARLPDTDGMALCRRLKNDPGLSQVPVIMLGGAPISAEERTAALRAGADEYLELPIPNALLLAYVDAKLHQKKSSDALREALAYAQSILASMRELMLVLDADLHVISANRAFYHFFHATPAETEGKSLFELSIPNIIGEVVRARQVTVQAQNTRGKHIQLTVDGFLARAFQHEIDHLDGVLFIDKVTSPDALRRVTPEGKIVPMDAPLEKAG